MGYALPAAMAAKLTSPERDCVAVCGDGGFAMTMNALFTAAQYRIPVVTVVLNNSVLGWVKDGQRRRGNRFIASELGRNDYARIAQAMGCVGVRVETIKDLVGELDRVTRREGADRARRGHDRGRAVLAGPVALRQGGPGRRVTMRHKKKDVIARTRREYAILDRLVTRLRPADWKRRVPRPPTRDPWTVKDALAHIVYWKEHSARVFRGERRLPEMRGLDVDQINRLIYRRWRGRRPAELVAWHRRVQRDVLQTSAANPPEWFSPARALGAVAARLRRALVGAPDGRHRGRAGAGARDEKADQCITPPPVTLID